MEEYREEVVKRDPPTDAVEERVTTTPVVEERVVKPAPPVETVRRRSWWRPTVQRDLVSTNVYAAPTYYDSTLDQFVRVLWYLLGLLEGLLAIRFILALTAANPNNGFASAIYAITGPFVAPFRTLFATPAYGGSVFEMYTLIAMLVYFLAWWAIVRLVEVVANRPVDA